MEHRQKLQDLLSANSYDLWIDDKTENKCFTISEYIKQNTVWS